MFFDETGRQSRFGLPWTKEVEPLNKPEWVAREIRDYRRLGKFGLPVPSERELRLAWNLDVGTHEFYLMPAMTLIQLFRACIDSGIIVGDRISVLDDLKSLRNEKFVSIPTELGVISCDFRDMFVPTDGVDRPFRLTQSQRIEWAIQRGGDTITSVEEALFLLLRAQLELGRRPFMGGVIHCRNTNAYNLHMYLVTYHYGGLDISTASDDVRGDWYDGAIARFFTKL